MTTRATRAEFAAEMLKICPPDDYDDAQKIASAITNGISIQKLLYVPEVFHWPKTYMWLADHLNAGSAPLSR
jgi:hypothetical protein